MPKRHAVPLIAISLLFAGVVGRASAADPAVVRACGLNLSSGHLNGIPEFAVPDRGRAVARRLAGGWLRCTLERADGTRFAEAHADARRRVLGMRFFRTTGAPLVSVNATHAATSASEDQRVACGSAASATLSDVYWRGSRNWSIGATVAGIAADKVVKAVRDAQGQWTKNINWCGIEDGANPPANYLGRTSKKAGQDGQSVVEWGAMQKDQSCAEALACTATWYDAKGKPAESDIRFNTAYKWVIGTGNGNDQYDIQSVAAHEIGHVYQLDHVSNDARNDETTVMWPYEYPGDTSARKLGKGDAQANNQHY